uniref:Uncharacterized protein n=1 Tax=viral metagenome TaxID=1070528 RepID=A0A6C0K5U0_9ZZZZ
MFGDILNCCPIRREHSIYTPQSAKQDFADRFAASLTKK